MEAVPVFDGAWEEGLLTVLGAAVGDLVGEVMCRVASGLEKSGKFDIFSRSGNCQGILKIGQ